MLLLLLLWLLLLLLPPGLLRLLPCLLPFGLRLLRHGCTELRRRRPLLLLLQLNVVLQGWLLAWHFRPPGAAATPGLLCLAAGRPLLLLLWLWLLPRVVGLIQVLQLCQLSIHMLLQLLCWQLLAAEGAWLQGSIGLLLRPGRLLLLRPCWPAAAHFRAGLSLPESAAGGSLHRCCC